MQSVQRREQEEHGADVVGHYVSLKKRRIDMTMCESPHRLVEDPEVERGRPSVPKAYDVYEEQDGCKHRAYDGTTAIDDDRSSRRAAGRRDQARTHGWQGDDGSHSWSRFLALPSMPARGALAHGEF